jgi:hypothetical protein
VKRALERRRIVRLRDSPALRIYLSAIPMMNGDAGGTALTIRVR